MIRVQKEVLSLEGGGLAPGGIKQPLRERSFVLPTRARSS